MSGAALAGLLELHQSRFNGPAHILRDPVQFPRRYERPDDQEAVAFLAATLAFGRVAAFGAVLDTLLSDLGPRPAQTLREAATERGRATLGKAGARRYRWLAPEDITALLFAVGGALSEHGSLQTLFAVSPATGTWDRLGAFLLALRLRATHAHPAPEQRGRALAFLFPSTEGSAACKRQHLFLRWMVRPDTEGVDLGLWTTVSPADLIMPCDVHTARIGHALGLTSRAAPGRRSADQLTRGLRAVDPRDPVRFDFALCHLGISGGCRARRIDAVCGSCALQPACRWGALGKPVPRPA